MSKTNDKPTTPTKTATIRDYIDWQNWFNHFCGREALGIDHKGTEANPLGPVRIPARRTYALGRTSGKVKVVTEGVQQNQKLNADRRAEAAKMKNKERREDEIRKVDSDWMEILKDKETINLYGYPRVTFEEWLDSLDDDCNTHPTGTDISQIDWVLT